MMAPRPAAEPSSSSKLEGVVLPMAFSGDDVALIAALRENHPGAKAAFFHRHASYVERIITHVIGFDRELPDILQEVFLSALASLHTLRDPRALKAWLSRVAAMTARKVIRGRSRRAWLKLFKDSEDEARWETPALGAEPDVLRALKAVYLVLDGMPIDERIAFALRFIEGMEVAEVAGACGVSLSTAKRRVARSEQLFVAGARRQPELVEWLKEGTRWQRP